MSLSNELSIVPLPFYANLAATALALAVDTETGAPFLS